MNCLKMMVIKRQETLYGSYFFDSHRTLLTPLKGFLSFITIQGREFFYQLCKGVMCLFFSRRVVSYGIPPAHPTCRNGVVFGFFSSLSCLPHSVVIWYG